MGRRGCLIVNRDGTEHIPAFDIEMVDKTCAGDAFVAGFLLGVVRGWPLDQIDAFVLAYASVECVLQSRSIVLPPIHD